MKKTFKLKALAFSILLLVLPLSAAFAQFSSNPSAGGSALDRIMAERGITDLDGRGGADLERYLNSIKDKDQLAAYHAAISKELADTTKVYNDAKAICDLWDKRDGLLKWLDEERRKHQGALATPLEIIGDTSKPFKVQSDTRVKQTRYVYKRVIRLAPDGNGALCDRNALAEAQARKALLEKAHNHTRRAVETFDERRSEWVREIYSDRGFFTPNPGDLSIVLLGRVFGVVGNVLPGGGNQILGSLIGIFNAAWVVAIGLGVFWIVFSSVVAAAGSGEMMAGKGKKTVFHIIRIVVGFSLVVPSATTGYSLAQTATMWVAVQGVGMGSRVYERFNDFIKVSGSVVQTKPLKSEELEEIMPMSLAILQATTCMYKLQDLLGHTSRLDNEVSNQLSEFSDVAAANNRPTNPMEHVGYGVNSDNTITFGTRRKGSSDPQYNSECGRIQLDTFAYQNFPELMKVLEEMRRQDKSSSTVIDLIALVNQTGDSKYKDLHIALAGSGDDYKTQLTMGQIEALFKELTTYQRLAALETILQVRPVARNIAAADIRALQHEDKKGVLNAIMKESAKGMGDSVIAFATIFDPIRTRFTDTGDGNRQNRLKQMRELGWLYTPLVALDATRAMSDRKISEYMPGVSGPDMESLGRLINPSGREKLELALNLPASIEYDLLTKAYLGQFSRYSSLGNVKFEIKDRRIDNSGSWGFMSLSYFGGFAVSVGNAVQKPILGMIDYLTKEGGASDKVIRKSGVTRDTVMGSLQAGPGGPLFVVLIGMVVGRQMQMLEEYVLDPTNADDAMQRLVRMGGEMIHLSIDSALKAAGIHMTVGLMGKAVNLVAGGILGLFSTSLADGLREIVNWVIDSLTRLLVFYIMFVSTFITAGAMLYFFLPMIPLISFFAMVINWFSMILINILGAPIFCFNLIRSDGEGMIGRGEKYITDIIRTMVTPAVLTIGIVAFTLMFDTVFALMSSVFSFLIPVLMDRYGSSPYIGIVVSTTVLLSFATMVLYLAQTLATLCTAHAVRTVGAMIGESVHSIGENMPHQEVKGAVSAGGSQATSRVRGMGAGAEKGGG